MRPLLNILLLVALGGGPALAVGPFVQPGYGGKLIVSAAGAGPGSPVPADTTPLVLWWQFDVSGLDIPDHSTLGTNSGALNTAPMLVPGTPNGVSGNTSDTSYYAYSDAPISYGTNCITVCFWMKPGANAAAKAAVVVRSGSYYDTDSWGVFTDGGGNLYGILAGASDEGRQESVPLWDAATWHHIALVFDGRTSSGDIVVYEDGVAQATTTMNNTRNSTADFGTNELDVFLTCGGLLPGNTDIIISDLRIYAGDANAILGSIVAAALHP